MGNELDILANYIKELIIKYASEIDFDELTNEE